MVNPGRAAQIKGQPVGEVIPLLLNPFWANLDPKIIEWPKDFFVYGVDFLPLGAGATATEEINIQADSHFLIMAGVRTVTDVANTAFIDPVPQLVRLVDSGSGRQVQNRAVHMDNLFGDAQLPAYWPYPKILKSNTTFQVELQNLDLANARNVRIDFLGFKLFKGQGYATLL